MGGDVAFPALPGGGWVVVGPLHSGSYGAGFQRRAIFGAGADNLKGFLRRLKTKRASDRLVGDAATAGYIALIALIAQSLSLFYVLFPELGALSHDILRRPHGTWAKAPVMLIVTPFLTAIVGTLVTQHLAYGLMSVLLTVGGAILIIRLLRSPIAPAISAGLLPLTLGLSSW